MLWCALYLPDLALQIFTRGRSDDTPLAILSPRPRSRVVAADSAAMACGVEQGIGRASALALAPRLRLIERSPPQELAALQEIATWANRFTPAISLDPPDAVLLEVSASLRLFGGMESLSQAILAGLEALGFTGQAATATTPLAARWLARHAPGCIQADPATLPESLDRLPLGALAEARGLGADILEFLAGIGACHLADVRRLPRAGLARRQAQAVTRLLDQAYGTTPDPRPWFHPPEHYASRLPLPAPTGQIDQLLFGLRRLLTGLNGWLSARQAGVEAFTLILEYDDTQEDRLEIILGTPCNDPGRCQLLAREHLARLPLPAPVEALRLEARSPQAQAPLRSDFFASDDGHDGDPGLLLATLRARLGKDAVGCIASHPDHRPERAWRWTEPTFSGQPLPLPGPPPPIGPRPLWLLPEPQPLQHPQFSNLLAGPERIETGWWDGAEVRRDYFVARNPDDSLIWIYRERIPPFGWYLHGYFA